MLMRYRISARYFYPRSPCGERLSHLHRVGKLFHFYPRSPCGERPWQRGSRVTYVEISIHALLAESDTTEMAKTSNADTFLSTLSLRRATSVPHWLTPHQQFLSTLSLRRATQSRVESHQTAQNFYPRSPCGERPKTSRIWTHWPTISIHALLAESDKARTSKKTQH